MSDDNWNVVVIDLLFKIMEFKYIFDMEFGIIVFSSKVLLNADSVDV